MTGVIEDGLNISAREFRITPEYGIPRLALSQLLQNCGDGNARAFNDRLPIADARIDFNSVRHELDFTHSACQRQALLPFKQDPLPP